MVTANHNFDLDQRPGGRGIPAWILSALFHFFLVIVLAFVIQSEPKGTTDEPERTGGIVLVKNSPKKTEYFTEEELQESAQKSTAGDSSAIEKALPKLNDLNEALPGFLPSDDDLGKIGAELGDNILGAEDFLDGISKGIKEGVSKDVTTEVFGVQGTGTKFVYVFDRSGSMDQFGGKPLRAAKSQLLTSLDSLGPDQMFQIVFYNDFPRAFTPRGGKPKLLFATDSNKKDAKRFVQRMPSSGGTHHLSALRLAVDFGPDVVFFLTDANDLSKTDKELDTIDRWNRNAATINSIEFGTAASGGGNEFLTKLAKRNGGKYVFKNVTLFTD